MEKALLATKLYIPPPRGDLVQRDRLLKKLHQGLSRKLTLVSAPAGFGKSALLSEYAADCGIPVAWISLDSTDNNPHRFLAYIVAAVKSVSAGLGDDILTIVSSSEPPAIDGILTRFVNEVAAAKTDIVLVLDDYHEITAESVHQAVTFIIDNQPPTMHIVISGRSDPPFPLARLRARGDLFEIRVKDLRFTLEETATFINDLMGLGLTGEDIAALDARTEGWIAGLQMAALSMHGRADTASFVRSFSASHRFILDYLVEEVLEGQPAAIQDFLLRTAVLNRMTAPLCQFILAGEDSFSDIFPRPILVDAQKRKLTDCQEVLEYLDEANLFVIPLDDLRGWYRYHHLFRDLLLKRLQSGSQNIARQLNAAASVWFEANGFIGEAIDHAFAGRDFEHAADLVERYAIQFIIESRLITLSDWLERLPEHVAANHPWLCVYHAWTRYWMGKWDRVAECLLVAERRLEQIANTDIPSLREMKETSRLGDDISGSIAAIQGYDAFTIGDIPKVIGLFRRAMGLLDQNDYMYSLASLGLGEAYSLIGDHQAALQAFTETRQNSMLNGYRSLAVSATTFLGDEYSFQGNLSSAEQVYIEAIDIAADPAGQRLLAGGFPMVRLGALYLDWSEVGRAQQLIPEGVELCYQWGHPGFLSDAYLSQFNLSLAQGDWENAKESLRKLDALTQSAHLDAIQLVLVDSSYVLFWQATEDWTSLAGWIKKNPWSAGGEIDYIYQVLEALNRARALIYTGIANPNRQSIEGGLQVLERALAGIGDGRWLKLRVQAYVLQAVGYQALAEESQAIKALRHALKLGQAAEYISPYIPDANQVFELLKDADFLGISSTYLEKIIRAEHQRESRARVSHIKRERKLLEAQRADLVEPLSRRELEVLRLLTTSLTSTEIAAELYISVSTVRTHIKNIYSKLGVHKRLEAVQVGREIGLL